MGRFLGYLFMLLALSAFAYDVWRGPMQDLPLAFTTTSAFWSGFHPASLSGLQSFIETSLTPDLWNLFVLPAISWPAFVLAGVIGLLFLAFSGRRASKSGMMFPRGRR